MSYIKFPPLQKATTRTMLLAPRMALSTNTFEVVKIPHQKVFNGVPFPLVVQPSYPSNLAEAVRAHKSWVESKLHETGAVLFRGFDVPTSSDFNDAVEGFGYEDFPFAGAVVPRNHVGGRVHTANESPPHLSLEFHNEMAYLEDNPSKVFFYCEVEPASQGETPIVLGHIVYERLKQNHSDFLRRVEELGLIYPRILPNETDTSSPIGRSWKDTFATDDKAIAELKAAKIGVKVEWLDMGAKVSSLKSLPGIKIDNGRREERRIWWNSLMPAYMSPVDPRYNSQKAVQLGDGSPIPPQVVEDCKTIIEEECVAIPWNKGDVLMLDNLAVQHARRPFTPPRRVLASFTM